MIENINLDMVNWARAQFALTIIYHWIFVPLTLGITWIIAFYETIYIKTGNEEWKRLTKFWMKLFGINFAIGVATGIIMEFEFGTNWSNYSWMVGDIFGAPLAIEGMIAFFMESTFFAVMFFGWDRVSKRFHLLSTWAVAIGSNISAIWILVANAWMQHPVGQQFNPDTARFEMTNFWDIALSPVAVSKFTHVTSSSMLLASLFIISISSWFMLKGRHILMAKRSIMVAAVFGIIAGTFTAYTGDKSAFEVAQNQPMKLAAFEGLWNGETNAGLIAMGVINSNKKPGDNQDAFLIEAKIPGALSFLANRNFNSFVPGINDLIYGNQAHNIIGTDEKMRRGKIALNELKNYKNAKKANNQLAAKTSLGLFNQHKDFLGYGFIEKPEDIVPPVSITFYAFHIMVMLSTMLLIICAGCLFFLFKDTLHKQKWFLLVSTTSIFMALLASEAGWVVAEVGRQPWAIQDLLPVSIARTNLSTGTVQTTFFMFLILFTALLIAEIKIMLKQISIGPEEDK